MKKLFSKFLIPLLAFVAVASFVVQPIADQLNINPAAVTFGLVGVAFTWHLVSPGNTGNVQLNGVDVEIWANYIMERFWRDNAFIQQAFSDDDKVLAGKLVHIPQPGALPKVVKNRTVLPGTVIRRADSDVVYLLDEYSTDSTVITQADKIELSYDKINSVYGDHAGVISQSVADDMIIKWLFGIPQASITKTSGDNTSDLSDGLTGTRKVFIHQDLKKWQRKFNVANVPQNDRNALLTGNQLDEMTSSLNDTQWNAFNQYYNAETGVIGKLYNFNIMQRSEVAFATNIDSGSIAVNPYGSVAGSADSEVALIWQKDAIARALGEVKFFENLDRAEYQGDVYSSYLRAGGRRRRADDLGVGMIVQATGS